MKIPTLGGTLITHNCFVYDYCFEEAIESMLPVCSELAVIDAGSTDGTIGRLEHLARRQSRLKILRTAWKPQPGNEWWDDLQNQARSVLTTQSHIMGNADEVLHEDDYGTIRKHLRTDPDAILTCQRINFFGDAQHYSMDGKGATHWIRRIGPVEVPTVGGAGELMNFPSLVINPAPPIRFFHYGMIRRKEALAAKNRMLLPLLTKLYDPIFDRVAGPEGVKALISGIGNSLKPSELVKFKDTHPRVMTKWLMERGLI